MGMAQPMPRFDAESYLAWEAEQLERHEFVVGEVYAMSRAGDEHNRLSLKIASMLLAALRGTPCRTFMSDMTYRGIDSLAEVLFVQTERRQIDLFRRDPATGLWVLHPASGAEVLQLAPLDATLPLDVVYEDVLA